MYKCLACGKQFIGGERLSEQSLWEDYVYGKQTLVQLSKKSGKSERTIRRKLSIYEITISPKSIRKIIVLMDTTYWGRNFGVMLFKDALTGENLYKHYVKYETVNLYRQGIFHLQKIGYEIEAIVCDGRRGLLGGFGNTPTQMCIFHQIAIVTRYLTRKPRTSASKELRNIAMLLKKTDKESFEGLLNEWHQQWNSYINEQVIDPISGKKKFLHQRLRSAYRSLKRNLPFLFCWYDNMQLKIPTTTNAIDGQFADLKNKLRVHNGLSLKLKMKIIDEFLKA